MDAKQGSKYSEVVQKQQDGVYDYPLDAGILDLEDYFSRGTLLSGLQWIQTTAGQQKGTSQAVTAKTRGVKQPHERCANPVIYKGIFQTPALGQG